MWPSLPVANQVADIANFFFIGSLVVGVVSTVTIVWMTGVKEAYWEKDRGESAERIAALVTQGDQLRKETADANGRAAEATQRAAEATLELAKFKAPRMLTEAQQAAVTEALRRFSGTRYDAGIGPMGDPEPLYLLRSIAASLADAGWMQVSWTGDPAAMTYDEHPLARIGLTTVTNVIVDVHPEYWGKLGPAAEALAEALKAQGIVAIADSKPTTVHTEVIHLRIGRKL
jgi:hypothetical protein